MVDLGGDGKSVDCVDLTQDTEKCRTFVNAVMNLRGPLKCEEFFD